MTSEADLAKYVSEIIAEKTQEAISSYLSMPGHEREQALVHKLSELGAENAALKTYQGLLLSVVDRLLVSHWGLYLARFGEASNPNDDIIRREAVDAWEQVEGRKYVPRWRGNE